MSYRHRCCVCGRFTTWDADNSTPFGNSYDFEPPEPEYYCTKCIEREKEYHKKVGWLPSNWVPARWEFEVAIELGLWRAGPKYAAWSSWHSIESSLPENYQWKTIVGWEEYTPKQELINER